MMYIKKIVLILSLSICFQSLVAQSFMHSFGATVAILKGKVSNSDLIMSNTYFSYFPRYNFIENENSSVSVGVPLGVGISIARNTNMNDLGIAFAYDLPVVVDYNIGCKSTYDNDRNFGGYFGVGLGYNKVSVSNSAHSDFKGSAFGPIFRGGVRIGSDMDSWADHGVTIGIFYKKGLGKNPFNSFGFNVYYDL